MDDPSDNEKRVKVDFGERILREIFDLNDEEIRALAEGDFDMERHLDRLVKESSDTP